MTRLRPGHGPQRATYRQRRSITGHTVPPSGTGRSPAHLSHNEHDSAGWGEAPLVCPPGACGGPTSSMSSPMPRPRLRAAGLYVLGVDRRCVGAWAIAAAMRASYRRSARRFGEARAGRSVYTADHGGLVHPRHARFPAKYAGIDGESVGGLVGSNSGARGGWLKLKSSIRFPSAGAFSRTVGRGSGRPSVLGSSRALPRKSSSMSFRWSMKPFLAYGEITSPGTRRP